MARADGALIGAWAVGEGLITYRTVARERRPPMPGELLASSGLFVLLGLLSIAQPGLSAGLAWALDLASFLNLAGSGVIGRALSGPPAAPAAPAPTGSIPNAAAGPGATSSLPGLLGLTPTPPAQRPGTPRSGGGGFLTPG